MNKKWDHHWNWKRNVVLHHAHLHNFCATHLHTRMINECKFYSITSQTVYLWINYAALRFKFDAILEGFIFLQPSRAPDFLSSFILTDVVVIWENYNSFFKWKHQVTSTIFVLIYIFFLSLPIKMLQTDITCSNAIPQSESKTFLGTSAKRRRLCIIMRNILAIFQFLVKMLIENTQECLIFSVFS